MTFINDGTGARADLAQRETLTSELSGRGSASGSKPKIRQILVDGNARIDVYSDIDAGVDYLRGYRFRRARPFLPSKRLDTAGVRKLFLERLARHSRKYRHAQYGNLDLCKEDEPCFFHDEMLSYRVRMPHRPSNMGLYVHESMKRMIEDPLQVRFPLHFLDHINGIIVMPTFSDAAAAIPDGLSSRHILMIYENDLVGSDSLFTENVLYRIGLQMADAVLGYPHRDYRAEYEGRLKEYDRLSPIVRMQAPYLYPRNPDPAAQRTLFDPRRSLMLMAFKSDSGIMQLTKYPPTGSIERDYAFMISGYAMNPAGFAASFPHLGALANAISFGMFARFTG